MPSTKEARTIRAIERSVGVLAESIAELNANAANDYVAKIARAFLLEPMDAPPPEPNASRLEWFVYRGFDLVFNEDATIANIKAWEIFAKRICGDYRKAPDAEDVNRAYKYVYDKVTPTPAADPTSQASDAPALTASSASGGEGAAGGMAHTTD